MRLKLDENSYNHSKNTFEIRPPLHCVFFLTPMCARRAEGLTRGLANALLAPGQAFGPPCTPGVQKKNNAAGKVSEIS